MAHQSRKLKLQDDGTYKVVVIPFTDADEEERVARANRAASMSAAKLYSDRRVNGTRNDQGASNNDGYASVQEQLDMQYKDQLNGTTTWKDHIAKVKSDHPKPE